MGNAPKREGGDLAVTAGLPSWLQIGATNSEKRLRQLALPQALLTRTTQIAIDYGSDAHRMLVEFFDALLSHRDLPSASSCDIVRLLDTTEQRTLTSSLLKQSLPSARSAADRETMNALLFQLGDLPHNDGAVASFVDAGMRDRLKARTGNFQGRNKHFNYHDARDALLRCKQIFDAADKRFFLDRGTLLGAVREGGFIASDYDIDVGIFADEITLEEVKGLFEGTVFDLTQDFDFKVGFVDPTGIQIDFFLTTRERGYFLSKGMRSIHNWYFTPFELMEYPFLGESFFIPATFEKHLDENYGNWRYPAIFYDLSYDEPCVVYGDGPEPFAYLSNRFAREIRRGSRYGSVAAATGLAQAFDLDVQDRFPRRVAPTVRPSESPAWTPDPILVIASFDHYLPLHRRVLESTMSITPDVRIHVVPGTSNSSVEDALTVARGIDRVTSVEIAQLTDENAHLDLDTLLTARPMAIVLERSLSSLLPSTHVASLLDIGCDATFFDDSTVAVTLADDRVVVRHTPRQSSIQR